MKLLNIGCGLRHHPEWTNLDIEATAPGVIEHDVRRGLPFPDASFDAVYHSHIIEHLTMDDACTLVQECQRVLKPGGVLRVVAPDLEGIARAYLQTLEAADRDERRWLDHHWMTVELVDQLVRGSSGGNMAPFIRDSQNEPFVRARIGTIFSNVAQSANLPRPKRRWWRKVVRELHRWRRAAAMAAVSLIEGREGRLAYGEGTFRRSGEIHRWMYDRVSLGRLLREAGLDEVQVCQAEQSRIPDYRKFELDAVDGKSHKPDSLFIEARKPAPAAQAAA